MKPPANGSCATCLLLGLLVSTRALAWGDAGHQVIGLVAEHYMKPSVRNQVHALLAADTTQLTRSTGIADEASWADKFRDSDRNTTKVRYELTEHWHFANIERDGSVDLDAACIGHPAPAPKASEGPAQSCVVDRVNAFAAEVRNPATDTDERRVALQFLLHFMGDLHQPLHVSDDHDHGGNEKIVKADGVDSGSLHHYWDTEFVKKLGNNARTIAKNLIKTTTPAQIKAWQEGSPATWAVQCFNLSTLRVFGGLGSPGTDGHYTLTADYVSKANAAVARQLARAGVRLAHVLNDSLGP
jgi:hypothetical protein